VDLVIESDRKLIAIEFKRSEKPDTRDARGIQKLCDFYGSDDVRAAFGACTTDHPYEVAPGVVARNGWRRWDDVAGT
jgi:hypothetical protein